MGSRISLSARCAFTLLICICAGVPAFAQSSQQVVIYAAAAGAAQTVLFVEGRNFGPNAMVSLGNIPLGGVTVNATGTALTATIGGILPGSYQLRVANGTDTPNSGVLAVTLGNVGATGQTGPQSGAAAGPPRGRSTASEI